MAICQIKLRIPIKDLICFPSGSSITTTAANLFPSNHLTSAQRLGFPGHHVRQQRQSGFGDPKGGLGANNANLAIPSESVAETGTSALDLGGQIGLVNSDGGINAGRLNEESLQSGIQLSEAGPLGQEMISQKFSTQQQVINSNSQRGSTTLIKETITEDINPSRVIIDQVFEDREIAPQLVSQGIIIQGRNITHIVAGPVNGLQQGSLQI